MCSWYDNTNKSDQINDHVQATQDEVAEAAVAALCKVFMHYIENYYDNVVPAPPVQCKLLDTIMYNL